MFSKKIFMTLIAITVLVGMSLCTQYVFASMSDEAKPIPVNDVFTDNLPKQDSVKYYKVVLPSSGKVNISFNHSNIESSGVYWKINMFDNVENEVLYLESTGNNTTGKSMNAYLDKGTHYIRITTKYGNLYHSSTDYNLTVNYTENKGEFEVEQNNQKEQATVISEVNKPIIGNLRLQSDIDYYKFTLQNSGKINIGFNHGNIESSGEYWKINMFDINENEVLNFDSTGTNTTGKSTNAYLDKGTYFIRITTKYSSLYHSNADYNLTVIYEENKGQFEIEQNNQKEQATVISETNKPISGNLRLNSDVDYYKFTLQSSDKINIGFNHGNLESSGEYWKISLYDSNDNVLLQLNSTGTNTTGKSDDISLNKGTYYILVTTKYSSLYHSNTDYNISLNSRQIKVLLNEKQIQFDQHPIIQNGRTLVPLRAIFEAIGANVTWNEKLKTITAVYENTTIIMKVGDKTITKNGSKITLDVSPQIINGRTLVPARAVAESFGAKVDWNSDIQTISITQ